MVPRPFNIPLFSTFYDRITGCHAVRYINPIPLHKPTPSIMKEQPLKPTSDYIKPIW